MCAKSNNPPPRSAAAIPPTQSELPSSRRPRLNVSADKSKLVPPNVRLTAGTASQGTDTQCSVTAKDYFESNIHVKKPGPAVFDASAAPGIA